MENARPDTSPRIFGIAMARIRRELGFRSARAFYIKILAKFENPIHYSYYVRMERGKVLPAPRFVQELAAVLEPTQGRRLARAYCESLFPNFRDIFEHAASSEAKVLSAGEVDDLRKFLSKLGSPADLDQSAE